LAIIAGNWLQWLCLAAGFGLLCWFVRNNVELWQFSAYSRRLPYFILDFRRSSSYMTTGHNKVDFWGMWQLSLVYQSKER